MGQCSAAGKAIYEDASIAPLKAQFEALCLRPGDVQRFLKTFHVIDVDGSGSIGLSELLNHLDLERNRFTKRIFSIFDEDKSGQIDFREFVLSFWNYCTLSQATLALFAFDLYDTDATGNLSPKEIDGLLHDLYGNEASTNQQAKQISAELHALEFNYSLDIDRFTRFIAKHPALLFPAFQMQHRLRDRVMGSWFWFWACKRRVRLSGGRYLTIAELTTANVDHRAYRRLIGRKQPPTPTRTLLSLTGTLHYRKGQQGFFSGFSKRKLNEGEAGKFDKRSIKAKRAVDQAVDPLQRIHRDVLQNAQTQLLVALPRPSTATAKVVPVSSLTSSAPSTSSGSRPGTANKSSAASPTKGVNRRRTFDSGGGDSAQLPVLPKRRPSTAVAAKGSPARRRHSSLEASPPLASASADNASKSPSQSSPIPHRQSTKS